MSDAPQKIFLTGASSGIGRAIAEKLCAHGHEVWGTSRDLRRLPQLAHFYPAQLDLGDPNSIDSGFARALAEAGNFDVVINNAGAGHFGPAQSLSQDELVSQFQLIVFAHLQILRAAFAAMEKQNRGLIVNITSLASRLPVPFMAAYNAAKAAMASFTSTLQLELSDRRIRFVDLQPADINTGFNDAIEKRWDENENSRIAKTWRAVDHNMKTAPAPELVARRVLRLIGEKNPPPRITVGNFFQATFAPAMIRLLPQRVQNWGIKNYYGL